MNLLGGHHEVNVEEIKILKSLAEPRTCTSSHLKIAVPRHLFDEKNKSPLSNQRKHL